MNHGVDNDMKEFNVDAKAECEQLNLSHETETKNASAQYRFNRDPRRKITTVVYCCCYMYPASRWFPSSDLLSLFTSRLAEDCSPRHRSINLS